MLNIFMQLNEISMIWMAKRPTYEFLNYSCHSLIYCAYLTNNYAHWSKSEYLFHLFLQNSQNILPIFSNSDVVLDGRAMFFVYIIFSNFLSMYETTYFSYISRSMCTRYGVESGQLFGHCTRSMKFESCKKNATITGPAEIPSIFL